MNIQSLIAIVTNFNDEAARLDLEPLTAEQVDCLDDASRQAEALDMLDDLQARCGMDTSAARELFVEATLTAEFRAFCTVQGLPFKNASDLQHEPTLTPAQHRFIVDFIARWDAAID